MGEDRDTAQDRVTIQEAARRIGVKEDAIRKRIQRGTLRHEKTEEGRVFVWVDVTQDTAQDTTEDTYQDTSRADELVEELRDRVRYLERVLEEERQARTEERRRHDTLMAQLVQRIPELEPPRESPVSPGPSDRSETPTHADGGAQEAPEQPQRRSWWREFFGFD